MSVHQNQLLKLVADPDKFAKVMDVLNCSDDLLRQYITGVQSPPYAFMKELEKQWESGSKRIVR